MKRKIWTSLLVLVGTIIFWIFMLGVSGYLNKGYASVWVAYIPIIGIITILYILFKKNKDGSNSNSKDLFKID